MYMYIPEKLSCPGHPSNNNLLPQGGVRLGIFPLLFLRGPIEDPLKPRGTILFGYVISFRGALNWSPIMPISANL